jgi:methylamine dehydrogenase accessory protein MauD
VHGWWAASYMVLWLLVVALCIVVVALARQIGTLHLRLGPRGALEMDDEGPPLGEAAAIVEATDARGEIATIGSPGEAQLLLFVTPGCRVCDEVVPGVDAVARSGHLSPYVVAEGVSEGGNGRTRVAARSVSSAEAFRAYAVPGTPYAVVVDNMGIVRAKGTVNNLEQMEGLVDSAAKRAQTSPHELGTRDVRQH